MKKLCVGIVLTVMLLFAQMSAAQPPQTATAPPQTTAVSGNPCGSVCLSSFPCDYTCDLCVGDPGVWEDGNCYGEMISATCGDISICDPNYYNPPCQPNWETVWEVPEGEWQDNYFFHCNLNVAFYQYQHDTSECNQGYRYNCDVREVGSMWGLDVDCCAAWSEMFYLSCNSVEWCWS